MYVPTSSARTLWEQFISAQCAKPELDLNKDFGKRRDGRQIGNLQTMIPLDHSCSQDVHDLSRSHVVMSCSGAKYDFKNIRLLSFAVPEEVSHTYTYICHPITCVSPWPHQLVENVHKVARAMQTIHKAQRAFVPDLAPVAV
jgi:hypothetical protein